MRGEAGGVLLIEEAIDGREGVWPASPQPLPDDPIRTHWNRWGHLRFASRRARARFSLCAAEAGDASLRDVADAQVDLPEIADSIFCDDIDIYFDGGMPLERLEGVMGTDEIEPVRVLLVEDDREFAQMYQLKLEADGYDVTHARDGEEGLRLATAHRPDLIFLDVRMPKMSGLELLKELRNRGETSEIPVVILSNYGEDELRQQGLALGIMEWLIKADVTPGQVSRRIELWSRGSSSPEPANSQEN